MTILPVSIQFYTKVRRADLTSKRARIVRRKSVGSVMQERSFQYESNSCARGTCYDPNRLFWRVCAVFALYIRFHTLTVLVSCSDHVDLRNAKILARTKKTSLSIQTFTPKSEAREHDIQKSTLMRLIFWKILSEAFLSYVNCEPDSTTASLITLQSKSSLHVDS